MSPASDGAHTSTGDARSRCNQFGDMRKAKKGTWTPFDHILGIAFVGGEQNSVITGFSVDAGESQLEPDDLY